MLTNTPVDAPYHVIVVLPRGECEGHASLFDLAAVEADQGRDGWYGEVTTLQCPL